MLFHDDRRRQSSKLDSKLEDELFRMKEENLRLKKALNGHEDKSKKLSTKIQRLSEDLIRTKDASLSEAQRNDIPRTRDALDNSSLVEELKSQVAELSKSNSQFKSKMQYFRALHEAESKIRTPYDHIPPRINFGSGQKRKLYTSLGVRTKPKKRISDNELGPSSKAETEEEKESLAEMSAMLRMKLEESDLEIQKLKEEVQLLHHDKNSIENQFDIDRSSLQVEILESQKSNHDLRLKLGELEEKTHSLSAAHKEILQLSENLNEELKLERKRNASLTHDLQKNEISIHELEELRELVEDLREEKRILERDQAHLMANPFGSSREKEYENQINELQSALECKSRDLSTNLDEKSSLYEDYKTLKEKYKNISKEKEENDKHMYMIQEKLDAMNNRLKFLFQDGEVDLSEVEEALSLIRLRKIRGVSLDFLLDADNHIKDKESLQELRIEYADCVHELDKLRKLLHLQEQINKDYKLEIEDLNRKYESMKNGYELRLEESSRLLDLRGNKIGHLESQLKNIVYGTSKVSDESSSQQEDFMELNNGQNLIEVHVEAAMISDSGLQFLRKMGLNREDASKLMTFVHYDFFDFETQVSPLGMGQKPVFNHTGRFKVYTDDFFLQYLQSFSAKLSFCVSNGVEFFTIATCNIAMSELTDPDRTERLRYYSDLISTSDGKTLIGKIDYGLRVRLPMAQAIRAYKERIVALNLLTVSDSELSGRRFKSRAKTNDLIIRIIQCNSLKLISGRSPSVYASFQFYIHEDMVTDTVRNSLSPMFNFLRIIPLPMTSDLDRYLRSSSMKIMIIDDNDSNEDIEYGSCEISLLPLAHSEGIEGVFDVKDEFGLVRGNITLSIKWSSEYFIDINPIVSKKYPISNNFESSTSTSSSSSVESTNTIETYSSSSVTSSSRTHEADQNLADEEASQSSKTSSRKSSQPIEDTSSQIISKRKNNFDGQSTKPMKQDTIASSMDSIASENTNIDKHRSSSESLIAPQPSSDDLHSKSSGSSLDGSNKNEDIQVVEKPQLELIREESSTSERGISDQNEESLSESSDIEVDMHQNIKSSSKSSNSEIDYESSSDKLVSSAGSDGAESDRSGNNNINLHRSYDKIQSNESINISTKEKYTKFSSEESLLTSNASLQKLSDNSLISLSTIENSEYDKEASTESLNKSPENDATFTISIEEICFDTYKSRVSNILSNIHQIFVGFEFLSFPPEELETHSVRCTDAERIFISFSKVFEFDEYSRKQLRQKLHSNDEKDSQIVFSIVSEPTDDSSGESDCVDIAIAELNLQELSLKESKGEITMDLTLWNIEGDFKMGTLRISISNNQLLRQLAQ